MACGLLVSPGWNETVPDSWQLPANVLGLAPCPECVSVPPDCEVSPNATIEPDPSTCELDDEGSGRIGDGGPVPIATYTARPVMLIPPKVGPLSGSFARSVPVLARRAARKPSESAL